MYRASFQKPTRGLLPLKEFQEENPEDFQTLEKFRVRYGGSLVVRQRGDGISVGRIDPRTRIARV